MTTRAVRFAPTTSGATTTCGGWTGWCWTSRPLIERMTLVWHDWFATSNLGVGSQRLMLNQNQLFRRPALGPFDQLLLHVTHDPAMLLWLNGTENVKGSPNENYGREMMELFTLGADRGALYRGRRSAAGPVVDRLAEPLEPEARAGRLPLRPGRARRRRQEGVRPARCVYLVGRRAASASSIRSIRRSSSRSCGHTSSRRRRRPTAAGLEALYRDGYSVKSVVGAILLAPRSLRGRSHGEAPDRPDGRPPEADRAGITTTDWAWIGQLSGQQLFYPPNVGGWDDTRWLDTATFLGRWIGVSRILQNRAIDPTIRRRAHPRPPAARRRARSPSGATPSCPAGRCGCSTEFASVRSGAANAGLGEGPTPCSPRTRSVN